MDSSSFSPLIPLFIAELLFGVLYALLIHWLSVNRYLIGSTAYSVVIGDSATLFIYWAFFPKTWLPLITFFCFVFSGLPMIVSYLFRHQQRVLKHKRRPLGNTAARIRDSVVMDLTLILSEVVDEKATVASVVHRLHQIKALLKTM